MHSIADLETRISAALPADRYRLRQQLRNVKRAQRAGKPFDRNLSRLTEQLESSLALRAARRQGLPRVTFSDELPVSARRAEIAEAIRHHQVVVVCGETGSGKSTQLPKICLELGRGVDGLIGHTQPRRIAARSVAARIAEEIGTPLGQDVGFKIRFTDATNPRTYVKLMTDGILLAESQHDKYLNQYDTIIVDEAHERSLNIDFLLGYLKRLLPTRPDLKVIITSATIDAERFSQHFGVQGAPAPIIEVSGRTYPVEVRYRPLAPEEGATEADLQQGVLDAVDELARIDRGDMLIFMPTEQDIHATAKALRGHAIPGDHGDQQTEIVPLYARLPNIEQNRVFKKHAQRRIVIATNVAESSLTVPGIRYVIDPGTARISRYSSRSKVQRLPIEPISQASADQRKGRCGRVGPGICIRLYTEEDYLARDRFTAPEIQRSNLAAVILQAKALNFGELEDFPFLDPPRPESVRDGYRTLYELGAIDERQQLTELGRQLSRMPVDPRIARMILAGAEENCLHEVLIIAAALEVQDPRERPLDKQQAADESHVRFADEHSDFLSYLKIWDFFRELKSHLSQNQLRKACHQYFLSYNRMREWLEVHRQLVKLTDQAGLGQQSRRNDYDAIHRSLLTGFLSNVAFRSDPREYSVAGGQKAYLWPGSGTFDKRPKWVVASEIVETNRRYLRTAGRIQRRWIEELAGHLVKRSYHDPHWDPTVGSAMVFENVSLFGLRIVHRRRVRLGPIDPAHARELFIYHGLVLGGYETRSPFLSHNLQLVKDLEHLQRKSRRQHFLRGVEARWEFYDRRIPPQVVDAHTFEHWRRTAERSEPRVLFMTQQDLLLLAAEQIDPAGYPDALLIRHMRLPLEYRFEPGTDRDGVTLTVPQEGFNQLDPGRLEWLVPGLLDEKVVALIKSLPKPIRRKLIPAAETAKAVVQEISHGEGTFAWAVARAVSRIAGESVSPNAFQLDRLPPYLRMRVRVVDSGGRTVATGRDLAALRYELHAESTGNGVIRDDRWNREGITRWDFGDLPEEVEIQHRDITLIGYPALVDQQTSVSLKLLSSPEVAQQQLRAGIRRLFVLANQDNLRTQVDWLPDLYTLLLYGATLPESSNLRQQLAELIADRAFLGDEPLPRSAAAFEQRLAAGRERLGLAVLDVLELVGGLLPAYHQARLALEETTNAQFTYATADISSQIEQLVAPGFLTHTPWQWLRHYPRYFRAIRLRLDKLHSGGLPQDQRGFELLQPRWQAMLDLAHQQRQHHVHDPQLEQYRWMLEEYRVSLFAQQLGTALPVSEKRLDAQWDRVGPY